MTANLPLLQIDGLEVHAAEGRLVGPVSLTLHAGQALTLLGESGAGKSLLAQAILGTLPHGLRATGRIVLGDEASDAGDTHARRRHWGRALSLLPQEPSLALDPTMRVGDQLAETHMLVGGKPRDAARQQTRHDLARLGLAHVEAAWPATLSGGMAQRLALAITRAGQAPVLIVDEPTKGLDPHWRDAIVAHLQDAMRQGCAVLTITHDIAVARALGGEAAVLRDGAIVEQTRAGTLLQQPQHAYTRTLIGADPENWPRKPAATRGAEVIRASGLAKRFGTQSLFRQFDLALHAGERVAVTGPSGSGKSTLGNVLLGLVRADAGRIDQPAHLARVRYQKLYQDPAAAFAPRRPLGLALEDLCRRHGLDRARIDPLMQRMRLRPALLARVPGAVSGGELQRFALLRALLLDPVFLFADEPTSRLDPVTQKDVVDLIVDVTAERGCALMLVTHDRALGEAIADRHIAFGGSHAA
ncbi:ABC transporter ATP-binding protein [Cupriavidus agavae]|uniref:Peptide/nickel transport system ATP-binding protein n=1 Tax=Cupriavidus agavae TaxID=1001822 RepID=A0A4V2FET2_9BURK|nr:ATP-binding cassette domain-containing protein [Cupriavidus agavae]RZT30869.1 peptide/nickel transport system ATP-binding protein [Cupriavidus agavae]